MRGKLHGRMLHVVGENGQTTRRATFDEVVAELEAAQGIIVRQRRIIEALKLEINELRYGAS